MTKIEYSNQLDPDDIADLVWQGLLEWLNSQEPLNPDIKQFFIERAEDLRVKMQAIYLEIQRKNLTNVAADIDFERELKSHIRQNMPFMTANQLLNAAKVISDVNFEKLKRIEAQSAGFDIFDTVQNLVRSVSEIKVEKDIVKAVNEMPSDKRQMMLTTLMSIVKQLNKSDDITIIGEAANDK